MLAVVQHQQQLRGPQPEPQRLDRRQITTLPHPQRLHHLRGHQVGVGDAGQISQPRALREPLQHGRGELGGQPGLPRPAGSGQRNQPRLTEQLAQLGQFLLAADETGQLRRQVMHRHRRRRRDFLPQHGPLQLTQLRTGFQPQLPGQHRPGPPVGGQRIGLPLTPVQRQHQQPPQPLPQRMLGDQALQFPGHLRMQPSRQVRLQPALHRDQPELLQAAAFQRQRLHIQHVRQRAAAPQRQRLPETITRGRRLIPASRRLALSHQPLKPAGIHQTGVDADGVPAATRDQRRLRLQRRPQPGHIRPQRLRRPGRCPAPPEIFDQPPSRNYPAHVQQQQCQHRPLPRAAQRDVAAGPHRLHRAQKPQLEHHPASRRPAPRGHPYIVRPPHRAGKPLPTAQRTPDRPEPPKRTPAGVALKPWILAICGIR